MNSEIYINDFALIYKSSKQTIPVDITSFRPDPLSLLNKNVKYKAKINFENMNDYKGRPIKVLRSIYVIDRSKTIILTRIR